MNTPTKYLVAGALALGGTPALAQEEVYGPPAPEVTQQTVPDVDVPELPPAPAESPALELSGQIHAKTGYVLADGGLYSDKPVLQPNITVSHDSGFYGDFWANLGEEGRNEIDTCIGWSGQIGPGTLDTAMCHYDIQAPSLGDFSSRDIIANRTSYSVGNISVGVETEMTAGRNGHAVQLGWGDDFEVQGADVGLSAAFRYGERTGQVRNYALGKIGATIGLWENTDLTLDGYIPFSNGGTDSVKLIGGIRRSF